MVDLLLAGLEAIAGAGTVVVVLGAAFVFWPKILAALIDAVSEAIYWIGHWRRGQPPAPAKSASAGAGNAADRSPPT